MLNKAGKIWFIRGRDLACIHVWWKFCRCTILLTNRPSNQQLDTNWSLAHTLHAIPKSKAGVEVGWPGRVLSQPRGEVSATQASLLSLGKARGFV